MATEAGWLRFELRDAKSSRFWEIRRDGSAYVVRYGKIGSRGREQRKEFESSAACISSFQTKIADKKRKGYRSPDAPKSNTGPSPHPPG